MAPDSDERSGVPRLVKLAVIIGLLVAVLVELIVGGVFALRKDTTGVTYDLLGVPTPANR